MSSIRNTSLFFLGVILQAFAVEARRKGGGEEGGGGGGGGGVDGGEVDGETVGIIVGSIIGFLVLIAVIHSVRKILRQPTLDSNEPHTDKPDANKSSKKVPDPERNAMDKYPPQDTPVSPSSPPLTVQYYQTDGRRASGPIPQTSPGPSSSPPTPHTGAAYTPSQYSTTLFFIVPRPPPTSHSPPVSPSPVQPPPTHGQ